ncbi:MAG: hypothetical protein Unbinned3528contig1000_25 [Prokaryotic dsDNA virus sp.]|mgnify:FL=1|nr:MAG: hypothetical protein Unbinned3528contig1000_25 [Prokaryotic dsDNA virus sp.]|tara:strand:+ start:222 stop:365 length:144 start_codon:yes stop_codon:yes gene_type:complete
MINEIIQLLEYAKGETENIRIAQGKYRLPNSFKEGYRQLKKEVRWKK